MTSEEVYTISEVARRLNVTPKTVRKWIRQGEIKTIPLDGSRQVIPQSALDDLLKTIKPLDQRRGKGAKYLLYDVVKWQRTVEKVRRR